MTVPPSSGTTEETASSPPIGVVRRVTTPQDLEVLGKAEQRKLAECEKVIEAGLGTFTDVGEALATIRDDRLYRATHMTFESYCRQKWGMSKTHANRMIASKNVVENLTPLGAAPIGEYQIRPLTKLTPKEQLRVWQRLLKDFPDPTRITQNAVTKAMHGVLGSHGRDLTYGPSKRGLAGFVKRSVMVEKIKKWYEEHMGEIDTIQPREVVQTIIKLVSGGSAR